MSDTPSDPIEVESFDVNPDGAPEPTTPLPAAVGLPVERVAGGWADLIDPHDGRPPTNTGVPAHLNPVPHIGVIPFGGLVLQAEQRTLAVGDAVVIGDKGNPRPMAMEIQLYTPDTFAIGSLCLMTDQAVSSNAPGLPLPLGSTGGTPQLVRLPLRRAVVKNFGVVPLRIGWALIGFPDLK